MKTAIASVTFETTTRVETTLTLHAMDMAIDANGPGPIADALRKAQLARKDDGNLGFTISAEAMEQITIGFEILGEIRTEEPDAFSAEEADTLVAILAHNAKVALR